MKQQIPIKSSTIAHAEWDDATNTLRVAFHTGHVYDYIGMHPFHYNQFLSAPSKGSFLKNVLAKKYQAKKKHS